MLLVSGAKVLLAADVTTSDIKINYTNPTKGSFDVSVGTLGDPTPGCYRVTLTANPATGYGISASDIIVQPLVNPSTRTTEPGIANNLTVSGSGNSFYFDLPQRYHGAQVTATFTEKDLTPITKLSQITDQYGCYEIDGSFTWDSRTNGIGTSDKPFKGVLDGNFVEFSLGSDPLFEKVDGAIIKNVIISSASVSTSGNAGAIANEMTGTSTKPAYIYNCGVLGTVERSETGSLVTVTCSSTISGSGYVGSIVGLLGQKKVGNSNSYQANCYARVINCYSFAEVSSTGSGDTSWAGGIVGYNCNSSNAGTSGDPAVSNIRSMVMNCMFYGNIGAGTHRSPVYGGNKIDNRYSNSLNNYNYYAYDKLTSAIADNEYNVALAAEEEFLNRYEFYRLLLNSNRKLAAWYVGDDASNMAKWVLDKSIATYPILKKQGKYPSVINYDTEYTYDENGNKVRRTLVTKDAQGKDLGKKLTINISNSKTAGGQTWPTDATIVVPIKEVPRIDKDTLNYNFNYDKVQLPYYNDVGTGNYTHGKVVTGWKITDVIVSGTGDDVATEGTFTKADQWGGYNFADRMTYAKDLYSKNGGRVFAQGAYFDVPYGATSITIEPYWGNAAYVADAKLDAVTYSSTGVLDDQYTNGESKFNGNDQVIYTSIANAIGANIFSISSGTTVYDNAIVLVGNLHQSGVPSNGTTPFTIMSVDMDKDNEPDYSLIYNHSGRLAVSPIRFDFINVPGTAMAQKPSNATKLQNVSVFSPKGWFEVTNTCVIRFMQFEYDNGSKTLAPLILLGGKYDQIVSTKVSNPDHHTEYIHVGGNAWFDTFNNGTHSDGSYFTPHIPISVTGGDYNKFYLSGAYKPTANVKADNAECYISGGRFGELAGAGMQQIDGNVQWQIYDADIKNFYGGGINAKREITGDVTVNIYNSHVTTYCGGPKFGDMHDDKKVITNAEGCTFGSYYGAGYGGASLNRLVIYNTKNNIDWATNNWVSGSYATYRGKYYKTLDTNYGDNNNFVNPGAEADGIATDISYDYFTGTDGSVYARLYVDFASFSKAITNDVFSTLTDCTISGNFYGGGKFGEVAGKARSVLTSCKVYGNVFGGGYSGDVPQITIRNASGFKTVPRYDSNAGVFVAGELADIAATDYYTWTTVSQSDWTTLTNVTNNNGNPDATTSDNKIKTLVDFKTLGQVGNTELIIDGTTYVRGVINGTTPDLENDFGFTGIDGETLYGVATGGETIGGVFGGGDKSTVSGYASVTIKGTRTEGTYKGVNNVYGGGNTADVLGNDTVSVVGGTMQDVYGGGRGQSTTVQGNVIVNIGKKFKSDGTTVQWTGSPTITRDVYGGSALGYANYNKTTTSATANATTRVNLFAGVIQRNLYGGGLGDNTSGSEVAANVYGPVTVTVEGGKAQNVYGCNNKYGTPKSTVEVYINGTDPTVVNGETGAKTYALQGVYGGGNLAHYDPTDDTALYPTVTVNGCSTSIKDVFGGGNAAAVPYTSVTINGGDIDRVFAGGNGESGTPANVGYKNSDENPSSDSYGAGTTSALIKGGTINKIFGGSNSKGTVRESGGSLSIEKPTTGTDLCEMHIGEVYGGGNLAPGAACNISVGCTGDEGEGIEYLYGGANDADVSGDITLNITDGRIQNVFGGNNTGHAVNGTITVNINQKANPCGWNIGNVYGGGNQAVYTAPTATEQNSTAHNYPQVNILNGTVSGDVFGGGYGNADDATKGIVNGNPQVTINGASAIVSGGVYGGGSLAPTNGDPVVTLTTGSAANIYGGGKAASVNGAPIVNINGGSVSTGVYGGCNTSGTVSGNITVSVTNGTIGAAAQGTQGQEGYVAETRANVHGGGYGASTATKGNVVVTINGASAQIYGDVYGGSALGSVNDAAEDVTTVTLTTGTIHGNIYGGGLGEAGEANVAKGQVNGAVTVTVNGGTVTDVFGCNNTNGSPKSTVTVNINNSVSGNVYGGGKDAAYSPTTAAAYPAVYINNGTIGANVYGGGKGSTATVTSNPIVTIGDATEGHAAIVTGDVYGGGDAAAVTGNTTVTYNDANTTSIVARLFGGGNAAGVSGTSTVTLTNGKVTGGIYGGCNSSGSVGAVTIALNGGTVGTDETHRADVYGGGFGNSTTTTGNIGITLGTDATTGTTVYGDIYGGSALGYVNASASNTSTVTLTSATLYGSVFGGGKGQNTPSEITATSNGGATVNINVANTNLTGIYGGANVRGNVKGAIIVNVNANVGASGTGNSLDIFGGGYGANTKTEGNVTVNIGDAAGTYQPVIYGDIYGGSALGNVNNEASDITTVNFLNGTLHGDLYGGGLGNADNAAKVNGKVIVNISNEDQSANNCHIDLRGASIFGCNNANGSPQDDVTVNIYKTAHTSDNGLSGTAYAIDQVFGGGDNADYAPENGLATSTKKATVNIIGCNNTIRRVFGGGNAAAAVGVVTRIDGGHFDYVYGGGNGEVTAANIGAGGTSLQIHGGEINNLFGGSNAQGTISGNMGVSVDNSCDCEGSGGTAQHVNEFFCGNNLASIGTEQNPVTIDATIACGTSFGAVYGGCNLAPLYGSVNLTVEGGVMDYVYGGSKGRLADNSDPTNPIEAVAADISGNVTLTINGGQIKNVFGGSNINGNIAGTITVNIERIDATPACADGWYVGNVYGGSNLAAYTPTTPGAYPEVNIKNGTVSGNVYGGGKGTTATVTSNPVVTIGDVTNENYVAIVADDENDKDVNNDAFVGGNVYGGGDAAPVVGYTTVTYNDNNANTSVANIYGGGNNASVSGNATVTLKGKATVEHDVFGGGNEGIVGGTAKVNIEE